MIISQVSYRTNGPLVLIYTNFPQNGLLSRKKYGFGMFFSCFEGKFCLDVAHVNCSARKPRFLTRSDTNWPIHP